MIPLNEIRKFWSKVDRKSSDKCWLWTGPKNSTGYGRFAFTVDGWSISDYPHRIAWRLANEANILKDLVIMHTCDNRACCNPAHLVRGTQYDNRMDCVKKNRHAKGYKMALYVRPDGTRTRNL